MKIKVKVTDFPQIISLNFEGEIERGEEEEGEKEGKERKKNKKTNRLEKKYNRMIE